MSSTRGRKKDIGYRDLDSQAGGLARATCLDRETSQGQAFTESQPHQLQDPWTKFQDLDLGFEEGNGNPIQYSCPENPTDTGAWWVTVHGTAESDTTERPTLSNTSRFPPRPKGWPCRLLRPQILPLAWRPLHQHSHVPECTRGSAKPPTWALSFLFPFPSGVTSQWRKEGAVPYLSFVSLKKKKSTQDSLTQSFAQPPSPTQPLT